MKKLILVLFIPFLLSCNTGIKSITNNDSHVSDTLFYFSKGNEFTCLIIKDSVMNMYEFHTNKGLIKRCVYNSRSNETLNCKVNIMATLNYKDSVYHNHLIVQNSQLENQSDIIDYYSNNCERIDSLKFWEKVSIFLDTVTMILPKDKFLVDQTYSSSSVDQSLVIDCSSLSKDISIEKGLPRLFFNLIIDKNGDVKFVEYNSWGKDVYKDLIAETKKILLKKSIMPYEILGYPINVKLDIGVIIR